MNEYVVHSNEMVTKYYLVKAESAEEAEEKWGNAIADYDPEFISGAIEAENPVELRYVKLASEDDSWLYQLALWVHIRLRGRPPKPIE